MQEATSHVPALPFPPFPAGVDRRWEATNCLVWNDRERITEKQELVGEFSRDSRNWRADLLDYLNLDCFLQMFEALILGSRAEGGVCAELTLPHVRFSGVLDERVWPLCRTVDVLT